MTPSQIPSHERLVRYIKPWMYDERTGLNSKAFLLRSTEKSYSVNRLDAFEGDTAAQLLDVCQHIHMRVEADSRFAEIGVQEFREVMSTHKLTGEFLGDPLPAEDRYPADPPMPSSMDSLPVNVERNWGRPWGRQSSCTPHPGATFDFC